MDRNNHGLSGKAFFYCRNGVKWHFDGNMIAGNEKEMLVLTIHVQYAANHLEKAKDVFMKAMKILWIYIAQWKENRN